MKFALVVCFAVAVAAVGVDGDYDAGELWLSQCLMKWQRVEDRW